MADRTFELRILPLPTAPDPMAGVGRLVVRFTYSGGLEEFVSTELYSPGETLQTLEMPSMEPLPSLMVIEGWSVDTEGGFKTLLSVGREPIRAPLESGAVVEVKMALINSVHPLTGRLTATAQTLLTERIGHTLTQTSWGDTLIVGGAAPDLDQTDFWSPSLGQRGLASIELIDGETAATRVRVSPGGSAGLNLPRVWHSASDLPSGDIFIAGGWGQHSEPATCTPGEGEVTTACSVEWIPPEGDVAVLGAELAKPRAGHTATVIDDTPTILFVGGDMDGQGTYEIWDPNSGSQGALPLPDGIDRRFHSAVLAPVKDETGTPAQTVVLFGGEGSGGVLDTGLFFVIDGQVMLSHPAALPKGGRVQLRTSYVSGQGYIYFVGGATSSDRTSASNAIDVYDVNASDWKRPFLAVNDFNLVEPRVGHTLTQIGEKMLAVVGGATGDTVSDQIEIIYEYSEGGSVIIDVAKSCGDEPGCESPLTPLLAPRREHQAVVDSRGDLLIIGGLSGGSGASLSADISVFVPQ